MVKAALQAAKDVFDADTVEISAQAHARKFYEIMGFVTEGNVYEEAGIEHIKMFRTLKND